MDFRAGANRVLTGVVKSIFDFELPGVSCLFHSFFSCCSLLLEALVGIGWVFLSRGKSLTGIQTLRRPGARVRWRKRARCLSWRRHPGSLNLGIVANCVSAGVV